MPRRVLLAIVGMALSALLPATGGAAEVPKLTGRVNDRAGILTAEQVSSLEAKLGGLETSDSTQIAVLVVPSLDGEALEEYSHRVASAWGIGQKGRDNGAVLVVALKERKVRIEVGYGLEPTLTDARTRRIISTEIVPRFRQGGYYEGIDAAVDAMIGTVRGTYQATPLPARAPSPRRSTGDYLHWIPFILIPGMLLVRILGELGGGVVGAGAGGFLMYLVAGASLPLILVGVVGGFLAGALAARMSRSVRSHPRYSRYHSRGTTFFPGGFWGGGSSGGGFSSGGFGGGFSGGGGSFGGGGSSGSW